MVWVSVADRVRVRLLVGVQVAVADGEDGGRDDFQWVGRSTIGWIAPTRHAVSQVKVPQ